MTHRDTEDYCNHRDKERGAGRPSSAKAAGCFGDQDIRDRGSKHA